MSNCRNHDQKANKQIVLGVARHSETDEELVVYQPDYGERGLWVRPKLMFLESVEIDGQVVKRFECMEEDKWQAFYLPVLTRAVAWWVSFHVSEKPMTRLPDPQLTLQWRERLDRFDQSELTIAKFCEREGYSTASFYQWRRKHRAGKLPDAPAFIPSSCSRQAMTELGNSPV